MLGSIAAIVKIVVIVFIVFAMQSTASAAWNDVITPPGLVIQNSTSTVTGGTEATNNISPLIIIADASISTDKDNDRNTRKDRKKHKDKHKDKKKEKHKDKDEKKDRDEDEDEGDDKHEEEDEDEDIDSFIPPEFKDFKFVELRGRDGHQGMFLVFGRPVSGEGIVAIDLQGDVVKLAVTVTTNAESKTYDTSSVDQTIGDLSTHLIEIEIPLEEFTLSFAITAPDESVIKHKTDILVPKNFSVKVLKSDIMFSQGEYLLEVQITNNGGATDFKVEVSDNKGFLQNITQKNLHVGRKRTGAVKLPIVLPEITEHMSIVITVTITDPNSGSIIDEGIINVLVLEEPLVFHDTDWKILTIPRCQPISNDTVTIQLIIVGTKRVHAEGIDVSTLRIGGELYPNSFEIKDVVSENSEDCNSFLPDGKKDLVLTFDWKKFLSNSSIFKNSAYFVLHYLQKNKYSRTLESSIPIAQ